MQEVAQRLKSLRESVGVSQAKLAAADGRNTSQCEPL